MVNPEIFGIDYSSTGFIASNGDAGCVEDLDNAVQAIKNRIKTRLGTYPTIDDEYGSEIYRIYGEKLSDEKLAELEIYLRNCLLNEPRVYEIIDLELQKDGIDTLVMNLTLRLVDGSEIGFEEEINTLG
jgi:hypothetical protein